MAGIQPRFGSGAVRKIVLGFFVATFLLGTQACASAPSEQTPTPADKNSFAYLAEWVGRGPESLPADNEFKLPAHGNLWDDPRVMERLEKTLGKTRLQKMLSGWGAGYLISPGIERVRDDHGGDYIAFSACKPHECLPNSVYVFISLADGAVQACWVEESIASKMGANNFETSEIWLSTLGERKLADGDCSNPNVSFMHKIKSFGDRVTLKENRVN